MPLEANEKRPLRGAFANSNPHTTQNVHPCDKLVRIKVKIVSELISVVTICTIF
jgi:hypothetical protein